MEKEQVTLDIYPASKWKRILIFLGDLLINYCLATFLYSAVVFNIASSATNYSSTLNESISLIDKRLDILYQNEVLYYEDSSIYSFSDNLTTSYNYFLKSLIKNEDTNVFKNYFIDIKGLSSLKEIYQKYDNHDYFIYGEEIKLNDELTSYFSPLFDPSDSLSGEGETKYTEFNSNFFTPVYNYLLEDISTNDLTYEDNSYIEISLKLDEIEAYSIKFNTVCIYISFFISSIILFIVFPLLFKDRGTLTMKLLKAKRIKISNSEYLTRRRYSIISINNILMNLSIMFFIGMVYVGFEEMFSYLSLFFLSLAGIIYILINLSFLLINKLNKSINELSTSTIIISYDDLEEIYKAKGYGKY